MSGIDRSDLRRDIRATLMPGFSGCTMPEWVSGAFDDGVVSVCIYGENVRGAAQLAALGRELRAARPDAIVAIDEEGGEVTRLHYLEGAPYPGAAVLGRIDDERYTEQVGARVARAILDAGFTLALAPDADVNSNPRNPVIGTRSFGSSPELAARHVAAWVRGLQRVSRGGLRAAACPKHFPGHGDTSADSHLALPTVDAPESVLRERELVPFRAAVAAGARAVMTSHILLPRLDPAAPATFSRPVLQGLLRDELGFEGVIVSDALDMRGASGGIGIPEAAVRALAGGCDLLCIGPGTTREQLDAVEQHVLAAVEAGALDAARVREAAERVRALARELAEGRPAEAAVSAVEAGRAVDSPLGPAADRRHDPAADPTLDPAAGSPLEPTAEIARIAASFAGLDGAHAWLAAHPGAAIVRVDSEANMAVGHAPWGPFAAAEFGAPGLGDEARRRFLARQLVRVDAQSGLPHVPSELRAHGAIVIGRDLHRLAHGRAAVERLRAAGTDVLAVEMGWPGADGDRADGVGADGLSFDGVSADGECGAGDCAGLATYGSSRLVGAALLTLLSGDAA